MFKSLISVEKLQELISTEEDILVVDCRFNLKDTEKGRRDYLQAHIPGALYAHLDEDLSGEIISGKTGRHPWPTVDYLKNLFSSWGVKPVTQVVTYDDKTGGVAARLWFLLRYMGHKTVAVLNGGWAAWINAGYPQSSEVIDKSAYDFQPKPRPELIADAKFVENVLQNTDYTLLDARAEKRYRGEEEPIDPIAGHITGAVSIPFADNLDENGQFLPPEDLKARFAAKLQNISIERSVSYCGSGVTACHNLLAMYHAGLGEGKLYPGSWSEWITEGERPMVTGNKS